MRGFGPMRFIVREDDHRVGWQIVLFVKSGEIAVHTFRERRAGTSNHNLSERSRLHTDASVMMMRNRLVTMSIRGDFWCNRFRAMGSPSTWRAAVIWPRRSTSPDMPRSARQSRTTAEVTRRHSKISSESATDPSKRPGDSGAAALARTGILSCTGVL